MLKKTLTAAAMLSVGLAQAADKKPNILVVFPDEMRQHALGFVKQDPVFTPNLDMFARGALYLPQTVSTMPLCSPFRACLLTGMYPHKTNVPVNCHSSRPHIFLNRDVSTVSDVLAKNNYDCAYIGKWHLEAPFKPYVNGREKSCYEEMCPPERRRGFNFWFQSGGGPGGYFNDRFWANKTPRSNPVSMPKGKWSCEFETDMAIKYIKNDNGKMRDTNKPFALFISWKPPHSPFDVPEKYLKLYEDKAEKELLNRKNFGIGDSKGKKWRSYPNNVKKYFAMVTGVDDQFGRLLKVLKAKGLDKNTIVVFTSDHGEMLGSHRLSGKNVPYDESFLIPFLIRWPGHIKTGVDKLHFNSPDIAPTLLGLAGLGKEIPKTMQGYNQAALLQGGKGYRPDGSLYWNAGYSNKSYGWRNERYTYVNQSKGPEILYDNKLDPFQLKNIAAEKPEVCKALKAKVIAELKRVDEKKSVIKSLENTKSSGECKTWKDFVAAKTQGSTTNIPDYSYAGYEYGEKAIPDSKLKIFNVKDFGAIPNDGKSDREAIQKAIKAAEANNGGVVFFSKGRFLINEKKGQRKGIVITKSNIILRGSGSDKGGTELFMREHLVPANPKILWSVPRMFTFKNPKSQAGAFQSSNLTRLKKLTPVTTVVGNTSKDSLILKVADASKLKAGDTIAVRMQNTKANSFFVDNLKLRKIWSNIVDYGVVVCEKLEIKSISGNTLTLRAPMHAPINPEFGFYVYKYPVSENWGVEDIFFRGNFTEKFVHHKDYIHDSGWSILSMVGGKNCYIRRCRISNVSQGFGFSGCMASSMLMNTAEGNRGHGNFSSSWGSNNLIGLSRDISNNGAWHGPGTSHQNSGTVIWRYTSKVGGGPDFHAYCPQTTLWDSCKSSTMNNGGNYAFQPNHLQGLTFWNFTRTEKKKRYIDFWDLPQNAKEERKKYFGCVKIVKPNYIGTTGAPLEFNMQHMGIVESQGKTVSPESLYEAQLQLRLGKLPKWIKKAKKEWKRLKGK